MGRARGDALNDRQRHIVNRLLNGFEGKLTSSKYAMLAKCSQDTAARDIEDLSAKSILVRDPAGGRSTSYSLVAYAADAFEAVARHVLAHADKSAWNGDKAPNPDERGERLRRIHAIAHELQELSRKTSGSPTYAEFESRMRALHELGMFLDERLVTAVERATRLG